LYNLAFQNWTAEDCRFPVGGKMLPELVISRMRFAFLLVFAIIDGTYELFVWKVDEFMAFKLVRPLEDSSR
jgi:hypothetical protein